MYRSSTYTEACSIYFYTVLCMPGCLRIVYRILIRSPSAIEYTNFFFKSVVLLPVRKLEFEIELGYRISSCWENIEWIKTLTNLS